MKKKKSLQSPGTGTPGNCTVSFPGLDASGTVAVPVMVLKSPSGVPTVFALNTERVPSAFKPSRKVTKNDNKAHCTRLLPHLLDVGLR